MYRKLLLTSLLFVCSMAFAASSADAADRWSRHDGRWYYWSDADARWYHMDGRNWYYGGDEGWKMYRFDGKFGSDWEIERDELEFDDDIEVPAYPVPAIPRPRVEVESDD